MKENHQAIRKYDLLTKPQLARRMCTLETRQAYLEKQNSQLRERLKESLAQTLKAPLFYIQMASQLILKRPHSAANIVLTERISANAQIMMSLLSGNFEIDGVNKSREHLGRTQKYPV